MLFLLKKYFTFSFIIIILTLAFLILVLLPHNLRSKSKSPVRQHPIRRKTSSKKQKVKSQLYENIRTQSGITLILFILQFSK